MKKFKNETKAIKRKDLPSYYGENSYLYDKPSKYLFQWSRALQATVSQAGTYKYTGKFHEQDCGIYKCEGGCNMPGVGELVLGSHSCYFDTYRKGTDPRERELAELISKIVVEWDPMEPVESMLRSAAEWLEIPLEDFKAGTEHARCGGVFGGNALSSFFDWNPFSHAPLDAEYRRWCLVNHGDMTEEQVDSLFADEALGKELLAAMQQKCREADNRWLYPMCCSPRRFEKEGNKLHFWINTGRSTQIDGWKTEEEIREFLASDGKLVDTR